MKKDLMKFKKGDICFDCINKKVEVVKIIDTFYYFIDIEARKTERLNKVNFEKNFIKINDQYGLF
jgi:hypothetical protein